MDDIKRRKPYLKTFLTPSVASLLFWLFTTFFLISAGIAFVAGSAGTAITFLISILLMRVVVECAVILFQIHGVLVDIRNQGDAGREKEMADRAARLQAARIAALAQRTEPGEHRLG